MLVPKVRPMSILPSRVFNNVNILKKTCRINQTHGLGFLFKIKSGKQIETIVRRKEKETKIVGASINKKALTIAYYLNAISA